MFATFCVIAVTLVGQGTSLPWLLRKLSLAGSDVERKEYLLAQRRCTEVALRKVDQLAANEEVSDEVADLLRRVYERRLERVSSEPQVDSSRDQPSMRSVQRRLLSLQHETLRRLHREGEISYSVMRKLRYEFDLEQASLGLD